MGFNRISAKLRGPNGVAFAANVYIFEFYVVIADIDNFRIANTTDTATATTSIIAGPFVAGTGRVGTRHGFGTGQGGVIFGVLVNQMGERLVGFLINIEVRHGDHGADRFLVGTATVATMVGQLSAVGVNGVNVHIIAVFAESHG
jgi:hypothetical protein